MSNESLDCCVLQDDISQLRKAYEAFLAQYPLCYGYWKKYAEAERRHGSSGSDGDAAAAAAMSAAAAVYKRGVAAVPHSAELWVAYATLLQGSDAPTDSVRRRVDAAAPAGVAGGGVGGGAALSWSWRAHERILLPPRTSARAPWGGGRRGCCRTALSFDWRVPCCAECVVLSVLG
jgi:hypothetical protein